MRFFSKQEVVATATTGKRPPVQRFGRKAVTTIEPQVLALVMAMPKGAHNSIGVEPLTGDADKDLKLRVKVDATITRWNHVSERDGLGVSYFKRTETADDGAKCIVIYGEHAPKVVTHRKAKAKK